MSITHSWNGTVLTITSDAGTSSADLKGDTGCRGPQGPAGIVYGDTGDIVLDGYATEAYVDDKVAAIDVPDIDMTDYYTKSEVDAKTEVVPLSDGKIQFGDTTIDFNHIYIDRYATKDYVDGAVANSGGSVDLSDYYTKTEVDAKIANLPSGGTGSGSGSANLSNYYTKSEVDAKIGEFPDITDEDGNQFIHSAVDYIHYCRDEAMGFTDELRYEVEDNFATKEYVDAKITYGTADLEEGATLAPGVLYCVIEE